MFKILRKDNTFCAYMQTLLHFFVIFLHFYEFLYRIRFAVMENINITAR